MAKVFSQLEISHMLNGTAPNSVFTKQFLFLLNSNKSSTVLEERIRLRNKNCYVRDCDNIGEYHLVSKQST